jgi:hypothetical protein
MCDVLVSSLPVWISCCLCGVGCTQCHACFSAVSGLVAKIDSHFSAMRTASHWLCATSAVLTLLPCAVLCCGVVWLQRVVTVTTVRPVQQQQLPGVSPCLHWKTRVMVGRLRGLMKLNACWGTGAGLRHAVCRGPAVGSVLASLYKAG